MHLIHLTPKRFPAASGAVGVVWSSLFGISLNLVPVLCLAASPAPNLPSVPPYGQWLSDQSLDNALNGRIWSQREKTFISPQALAAQLAQNRYVLLGEVHDNPDHHALQAWIIRKLVERGRKPAVVMEQISRDKAEKLAAFLAGDEVSATKLGPALDWHKSGWPKWTIYQPIAEIALQAGLPIRAGNPAPSLSRAVGRRGWAALKQAERDRLRLSEPLGRSLRQAMIEELVEAHCNLMPAAAMAPLVRVQRLRDAVLADSLIEAGKADGAVLIAGGGHVRNDRGVPWYLSRRGAGSVATVVFLETGPDLQRVEDLQGSARALLEASDYVWFTPAQSRPDPCAKLRKYLKKKADSQK